MDDLISRQSIKKKLQEHHDFFIKAYGGFKNLPLNDKSRVDEITNCIAEIVNEPSVQPEQKMGHWIKKMVRGSEELYCSNCGNGIDVIYEYNFCPNCGCCMESEET